MTKKDKEDQNKFHELAKKWTWSVFLSLSTLFLIAAATQLPQIEQNRLASEKHDKLIEDIRSSMSAQGKETNKYLRGIAGNMGTLEALAKARNTNDKRTNDLLVKVVDRITLNEKDQIRHISNPSIHRGK